MLPIRDTVPAQRFPVVNTTIIVLNVLVFLFETALPPAALDRFIGVFGFVPARFWASGGIIGSLTIFTSMFLHGGWSHLISNMLALYIFGDNVEDRMGHGRYLLFYLLGGIVAALVHAFAYADSVVPTVGASGAISAVLGAYLVLYPLARVITIIPFPFFFYFPVYEIPAIFYLGIWFFSQFLNGTLALVSNTFQQGGGVAWWAHIGGFIAGFILVRLFARRQPPRARRYYYYPDEFYPW
ncbi:MAG: rhomboid family intramembrane serine protease [Chloroflexi bacterium]|nr:MAG: rhomboid family intramembrane serine protease [Chloroflexota bacterium]